ncbi:DUF2971 domain-containing protein [Salmonella enterica]|uniref:DUF2971 domain-containing protein n=1 Tax=Salmonella enterica subsp. enterica serovar 4,[5],12:b:- TaxID=1340177 RepID=A0A736HZF4_SALET|nr:DUF2971 domain-containing protein [Salmonella enterica]EAA5759863.1 DUF2971 domain-containing protein [Salmonella enterica subsp. enterica]EAB9119601.1 DUF2971 domain-containing protein [Salmonella enterica subsp. enterica serovar Paratyphi B str. SPB7]EBS4365539.1 DUF2971 domain-containing protein [Salmonella enterica subsp. enterica serovar Stanley]ECW5951916.1 DUF2971 domain-containing protein [Salmonella enterica subsp. enterica serovar Paratyphi B]EDO6523082.1 DUF2971 domain-containing
MLVKYYGLTTNSESESLLPRYNFLSNGLFRMTQPKFLNDMGSESRLLPYFNEFSPADYEWAKRELSKRQIKTSPYTPSKEELEIFLKPIGIRYGDTFPHMLHHEGFKTMEDFDQEQLNKIAKLINDYLVETISCKLGVFSLCKSDTNENMWTYYAHNGAGLALRFKSEHYFFKVYPPKEVSYTPERRASLTYFKGMIRLNGYPLNNFKTNNFTSPLEVINSLQNNSIDIADFAEKILYSKAENWAIEDESRIICPLSHCEQTSGETVTPNIEIETPPDMLDYHNEYSEVNLKKIPFDAFDSLIFGYNTKQEHISHIIAEANKNKELSHLKFQIAKHDIFGKIQIHDLVV